MRQKKIFGARTFRDGGKGGGTGATHESKETNVQPKKKGNFSGQKRKKPGRKNWKTPQDWAGGHHGEKIDPDSWSVRGERNPSPSKKPESHQNSGGSG